MKAAVLLAALALAGCRSKSHHAPAAIDAAAADDAVAGWQADLDTIATELPKRHPAPFHQTSEADFRAAVDALRRAMPALDDAHRIVGLARIVALLADGHTQLDLGRFAAAITYPVAFYWFTDGLVVTDAAEPYRWAIGARVVTVGGKPVDDAIAALSSTVGYQADGFRRALVAERMGWPQFLVGTGFAPADGPARFGVVDATGATRDLVVEPHPWQRTRPDGSLPLYRQRPQAFYWSRYLAPERTLYVQYNKCANAPDLSFADFTRSVVATLDAQPIDRLVVDLRWNGGGDSEVINPLLDAIAARPALKQRLFALISRHTFSSGLMNAIDLDQLGALLVGEPAGSPASHYGLVKQLELPAHGLSVQHSSRRFTYDGYPGPALAPELTVELSSADYLAGKDPVLDAALALPLR